MASKTDLFSPYFVILQENEHGDPKLFLLHVKEQPFFAINDKFLQECGYYLLCLNYDNYLF